MKILALDFSSPQRSVALAESRENASTEMLAEAAESGPRSLKALVLIDAVLQQARLKPDAVECLAIGLGPGSYTGIRAAIAVAQGWQLAGGVKLLGISSVEALAAQAARENLQGPVNFLIDAQRNEFYLAQYEMLAHGWRIVEPLRLATFAEVKARADAGAVLAGPEVNRWFASGQVLFPGARVLAELAARSEDFVPGDKLAPIYLRETSFVKAPPRRTDL